MPDGAGWKARRESRTVAGLCTMTTTYDITHDGYTYTQKETQVGDAEPVIETSDKRPAAPDAAPLAPPIGPPLELPKGAGWKARRESVKDQNGKLTMYTTYDITHGSTLYTQKETQVGDEPPVITDKGDHRPAPPPTGSAAKPILEPIDLPAGAGWRASRTIIKNEQGIETTTTTYVITARDPATGVTSEYQQRQVQIGDEPSSISKSEPTLFAE